MQKKQRRIFPWVFLTIQIIFIIWLIAGAHNVATSHCTNLSAADCTSAKEVGGTIGGWIVVGFWVATDFVVCLSYTVYRLFKRG